MCKCKLRSERQVFSSRFCNLANKLGVWSFGRTWLFSRAPPMGRPGGGLRCWLVRDLLEMFAGWVCRCREEVGQSRLTWRVDCYWGLFLKEISPVSSIELANFSMYDPSVSSLVGKGMLVCIIQAGD